MPNSKILWLAAFLTLLVSCSAATPGDKTANSYTREKRDIAGLFPFPRIGRTLPLSWPFLTLLDYDSADPQSAKRDQLIPFPRVGKSGPKRNGASGGGGLWFGPRLGRLSKRMELIPTSYHQDNTPENSIKSASLTTLDDFLEPKQ